MAFIKCSGGGKLKETVLWSNPNPSASFAAQSVTLNQSMRNFEYLKFTCFPNNKNFNTQRSVYTLVSEFIQFPSSSYPGTDIAVCVRIAKGSNLYCRRFAYLEDDYSNVQITPAYIVNGSGISNADVIPYRIYGLKY